MFSNLGIQSKVSFNCHSGLNILKERLKINKYSKRKWDENFREVSETLWANRTNSSGQNDSVIFYFNVMFCSDLLGSPQMVLLSLSNGNSVERDYLHGGFLHRIPPGLPGGPNNAIIITVRSRCFWVGATWNRPQICASPLLNLLPSESPWRAVSYEVHSRLHQIYSASY